jgi:hypothetical protein
MSAAPSISAIQTTYRETKFRSRLEARWAVFFDVVGFVWHYEPEAYALEGQAYLPDFFLPDLDSFFEIKPTVEYDQSKPEGLCLLLKRDVYVLVGEPAIHDMWSGEDFGNCRTYSHDGHFIHAPWTDDQGTHYSARDNYQQWCECPHCHKIGIEFDARAARLCNCLPQSENKGYNACSSRILKAYVSAQTYRFWNPS